MSRIGMKRCRCMGLLEHEMCVALGAGSGYDI